MAVVAFSRRDQAHAFLRLQALLTIKSRSAAPPGRVHRAALVATSEGATFEGISVLIRCHIRISFVDDDNRVESGGLRWGSRRWLRSRVL